MKGGPTSTIRSSLDPGKTAGDLAKERNKLEVSRRIDQVPPAQKSNEKNSKNRFTTNIVDASSDIFWKGFLWLLVVAQSILEDELYDALADLGSFQNIGESESTAWFAKIPNPCNAIPLSVKSQKIPNARGRKSSEQLSSLENLEMEIWSHLKLQPFTLWLPEKDPVSFFQRICQLVDKTSGSGDIGSLLLISIVLDFTRGNFSQTHLSPQPICAAT